LDFADGTKCAKEIGQEIFITTYSNTYSSNFNLPISKINGSHFEKNCCSPSPNKVLGKKISRR